MNPRIATTIFAIALCASIGQARGMCYMVLAPDGRPMYQGTTPPVSLSGATGELIQAKFPGGHMVITHGDQACGSVTLSAVQDAAFNKSIAATQGGASAARWIEKGGSDSKAARLDEIVRQADSCRDPMYAANHLQGECSPQRMSQLLRESRQIKMDLSKDDPDKQRELKQEFAEGNRRIEESRQRNLDRNRTMKCKANPLGFGLELDCK